MNFCTQCGSHLEENAHYCISCGKKVEDTFEPIVLPPVEKASWGLALGAFFGAFLILSVICFII